MEIDQQPPHGLFLKWGRFQIGAFGIPAVATVLTVVVLGFWGRWFGLW
jgi:branched-subunit amino acid transport protein AzlD